MADPNENYKKALENVESMLKKQEALNNSADKLKNSWNAISSQIFGLDGAAFFKQIPLSVDEIKDLNSKLRDVNEEVRKLGKDFGDALDKDKAIGKFTKLAGNAFAQMTADQEKYGAGTREAYDAETKYLEKIRKSRKEFSNLSDDDLKVIGKQIQEGGKLSEIYDQLEETSKNIIKANSQNPQFFLEAEMAAKNLHEQTEQIRNDLEKGTKEAFSLKAGLKAAFSNVVADGLKSLMEFDQTINDVQKNTGIMMDANSAAFGDLTSRVAVFGVSAAKAGEYMTAMSDELDTTNFSVLSKAAEDFALIEGATGASADEITTIGGQLMRMGKSSAEVKDYMEDASNMAKRFGVNSKKAIGDISRNISKMRSMGFAGGEKSLAKMVITAQKLNMNVDEIFDVAKKARTIEGAMEMASELQLAGGSFANINPMDLLAAARGAPGELQKILNSMGKDVGKFNKETGEYEFDAVDMERLQMVADATNQTLDNVMNGIQKSGLDKVKLDPFKDMMGGLDEADKALAESTLGDMMKFNKDTGKMELDVESDMAKKMGITDLDQINGSMITDMLKMKKEEDKTLEEQNARNQSFQESLTNFWMALQSIFSVFEPVLRVLTTVMQSITSTFSLLGPWSKLLIAGLLLFGTGFAASVLTFSKNAVVGFGKNIKELVTSKGASLFNKVGKKAAETATEKVTTPDLASKAQGPPKTVGGGLTSLATGLSSMGTLPNVLKGIGLVALAGPAFLLFTLALPGLLVMALAGVMSASIISGFTAITLGLSEMGVMPNVIGGIGLLALAGPAFLVFGLGLPGLLAMALAGVMSGSIMSGFTSIALGLSEMGVMPNVIGGIGLLALSGVALLLFGLGLPGLLAMALVGVLSVPIGLGFGVLVAGFSALGVAFPMVALGAAALALIGVALLLIAGSLLVFGMAGQMISETGFGWLFELGGALLAAAPGLFFGGLALLFATPGLLLGSLGLMAISQASLIASQVDWAVIAGMGSALSAAAGGLFLFSLSAMMFANPFTLIGMMFMVVAISALAAVMVPLAASLQLGADSLTNFAIGLERLSAAADLLSDEKLAKLQKISEAMAKSAAAGNVAGAMASTAEAAGGGGAGGGGGTRKLEIDIKMNGRDVAYTINKDTQIVK